MMSVTEDSELNITVTAHLRAQVKKMAPVATLPGVHSWEKSADPVSNTVCLAAPRPSGGLNILLADFNGQALAAAISILPVAEVFYGMTAKGFGLSDLLAELNQKLCVMLPENLHCSACLAELDQEGKMLAVWNGGLPEVIIMDEQQCIRHRIPSSHTPLGLTLQTEKKQHDVTFVDVDAGDRMYVCTQAMHELLAQQQGIANLASGADFSKIALHLNRLTADQKIMADLLLLELDIARIQSEENPTTQTQHLAVIPPADWQASFVLTADVLKRLDLVPLLTHVVMTIQAPYEHKQRIYTVLAEMCSNALEHGVLKLDSALKQQENGFAEYYALRGQRLAALEQGEIRISLQHKKAAQGGELTIRIEDSGEGFDYQRQQRQQAGKLSYSGRGSSLLRQLCRHYGYSGKGNIATAVYCWQ